MYSMHNKRIVAYFRRNFVFQMIFEANCVSVSVSVLRWSLWLAMGVCLSAAAASHQPSSTVKSCTNLSTSPRRSLDTRNRKFFVSRLFVHHLKSRSREFLHSTKIYAAVRLNNTGSWLTDVSSLRCKKQPGPVILSSHSSSGWWRRNSEPSRIGIENGVSFAKNHHSTLYICFRF